MKGNVKDWVSLSGTAKKKKKSQPTKGKQNINMLPKTMEASFKTLVLPQTAKHLHTLNLYFCIRFLVL